MKTKHTHTHTQTHAGNLRRKQKLLRSGFLLRFFFWLIYIPWQRGYNFMLYFIDFFSIYLIDFLKLVKFWFYGNFWPPLLSTFCLNISSALFFYLPFVLFYIYNLHHCEEARDLILIVATLCLQNCTAAAVVVVDSCWKEKERTFV